MFGHIIGGEPNPDYRRGILTADLAIGDTVLHVDDTGDFDEDAKIQTGRIMLGLEYDDNGDFDPTTATILYYDTCDEDTLTVTLLAPSPVAGSTGDTVYVYDPATGVPIVDYTVWVERDGADVDGDPLPVILSHGLIDRIGDSTDLTGQAIEFHEDEDEELVATDLPGSAPSAGIVKAKALDSLTVTTLGDQTLQLTYRPIPESEHLRWDGVSQDYDDFTRSDWTVTIPDPDGVIEVGDVLTMQYLYTDPTTKPAPVYSAPVSHARSGAWGSHSGTFITSDILPTGTEVGDLLVVAAYGAADSTITDPRLTTIATDGPRTVAIGYATDLSDVTCHVGGTAFPLDQFAGIEILSVHGVGDGVVYDPTKIGVHASIAPGGALGSASAAGHGSLVALVAGTVSGITIDMATNMPAYTDYGGTATSADLGNFGYCPTNPPPSQTNPTNANALAVVIGLK